MHLIVFLCYFCCTFFVLFMQFLITFLVHIQYFLGTLLVLSRYLPGTFLVISWYFLSSLIVLCQYFSETNFLSTFLALFLAIQELSWYIPCPFPFFPAFSYFFPGIFVLLYITFQAIVGYFLITFMDKQCIN